MLLPHSKKHLRSMFVCAWKKTKTNPEPETKAESKEYLSGAYSCCSFLLFCKWRIPNVKNTPSQVFPYSVSVLLQVLKTEVDVQTLASFNMNSLMDFAQALQQALVIQTGSRQPVPEEHSTLSSAHIKAHHLPFHSSINNNHCWPNDQVDCTL